MPKFQVTVADASGAKLYDETIDAPGPMEACAKAVEDARVSGEALGGETVVPPAHDTSSAEGGIG